MKYSSIKIETQQTAKTAQQYPKHFGVNVIHPWNGKLFKSTYKKKIIALRDALCNKLTSSFDGQYTKCFQPSSLLQWHTDDWTNGQKCCALPDK